MSEFEEGLATGLLLADGGSGTIVQKTFTENGTYHAIADAADGYDPVIVAVPIASKSITKNGIYYAIDDNLRGFDPVNVNVPMYWTFQPGETVPPSMITPDTHIEEDAPPSSQDVPYPTPEDPQRVIKPQFKFVDVSIEKNEQSGKEGYVYGGTIYDEYTGEEIESNVHMWHPKIYDGETFSVVSWELNGDVVSQLRITYHYSWQQSAGSDEYRSFSTDLRGYYASSGSGQNTTTVYGG